MQRRRLLQLGVTGATAGLLPVPVLTAAAQMLGGRQRVDAVALDTAQTIATHLAAKYASAPGPGVVRAADAHPYTLVDLLTHASMTRPCGPG